jgi:ABC-type polysaccharide/polyol phosphate transport system ATPase subunit
MVQFDEVSLRFQSRRERPSLKRAALDLLRGRSHSRDTVDHDVWLFRQLSLHVGRGERLGIIGGNGAGKTTLLKMACGIYPPSVGRIIVRGRISRVIELGTGFHQELPATENILLNGAFLGFSRSEMASKVDRILDFAGLQEHRTMPVKYYSSGMLLRLAFSIATDVEPEILLIDEVFGAGDAEFAARALARMHALLDTSHAALIVSHNLALIREVCTRAIWLDRGAIVADGAPDHVCDAYAGVDPRRRLNLLEA